MSQKNNFTNTTQTSFDDLISNSFGRYAKYIIQDRALPDVRDGLKPVQRRILYAMHQLGIYYNRPFKKSARTVGEVIGKYHPHGDIAVYEAMVRMSQNWKNRVCLIEMHGNNGSMDGDGPAAMRYTEARISQMAQIMLEGIDKKIVDFVPNFDDSESEPVVLPTLLPNILMNGASGIAAGYATNIPPFNFIELKNAIIERINNPTCSVKDIMRVMPGPDFPTGAIIQGKEGIKNIYETGRGKIAIVAKIRQIELSNMIQFVIDEIPYDVNKANLVKSIDEIRLNEKISGIKEVRDESNKDGISIVIDIEKNKNIDAIKAYLFKNTQLQISYNANMVVIKNRKPILASIIEIIDSYIEWTNYVFVATAKHDLNKLMNRKNIIEGMLKALSNVDHLIKIIRVAIGKEDASIRVQKYFNLNEVQANAIVSLRLYNLTNFDIVKLQTELEEIQIKIIDQELIINHQTHRSNLIKASLNDNATLFNQKRTSKIEKDVTEYEFSHLDVVEVATRSLCVTKLGYIKYVNDLIHSNEDLVKLKFKENDYPIFYASSLNTLQHLILITSKGRYISIPCYKIKQSLPKIQLGIHLNELITLDIGESVIFGFGVNKISVSETRLLIITKNGFVKQLDTTDFTIASTVKNQTVMKLKGDDEIVNVSFVKDNDSKISTFTANGMGIQYNLDEVPIQGRSSVGVINLKLKNGDVVVSGFASSQIDFECYVFSNKGHKKIAIGDIPMATRGTYGKMIYTPSLQSQIILNVIKASPILNINSIENLNLISFIPTSKLSLLSDKIMPTSNFGSFNIIYDFSRQNFKNSKVLKLNSQD